MLVVKLFHLIPCNCYHHFHTLTLLNTIIQQLTDDQHGKAIRYLMSWGSSLAAFRHAIALCPLSTGFILQHAVFHSSAAVQVTTNEERRHTKTLDWPKRSSACVASHITHRRHRSWVHHHRILRLSWYLRISESFILPHLGRIILW